MNYIEQFMKDNDIEVNEEFYIKQGNHIFGGLDRARFYFNEKLYLEEKSDNSHSIVILKGLLTGEYRIEKITEKPKSVWDLKDDDEYYYIDICGNFDITTFGVGTYWADKKMIEFGNAFLTREEAEHEVERRKCESVLLKYGTRDMINIGAINIRKYFIVYNNYYNEISISFNQSVSSQGTIYFESEELAQKAIEECGEDRLKKYVFNVKE